MQKILRVLLSMACVSFFCFSGMVPPFASFPVNSQALFFVFLSTIVCVVLGGVGLGLATFFSLSVITFFEILPFRVAMAGFAHATPWLVFFAFCFSRAFSKSGLGPYLAHIIAMRSKGRLSSFVCNLVCLDFILAPFVPSNAARAGSTSIPVINSAIEILRGHKNFTAMSSYIVLMTFIGTLIASALFLTGTAPNLLAVSLAKSVAQIHVSWMDWFLYMIIPTAIIVIVFWFLAPAVMGVSVNALPKLEVNSKRAGLTLAAKKLLAIFGCVLFLWIFGDVWGVSAVRAAFLGVAALLLSGVLSWRDITENAPAWDNFFWYGSFVSIAVALSDQNVFSAFGSVMSAGFQGVSPEIVYVFGTLLYFAAHYFFAGIAPYVVSLYPVFLIMFLEKGIPSPVAAIGLGGCATLSAVLTHYGSTLTPLFWGLGVVHVKTWWRVGACVGVLMCFVMTVFGFCVWKVLY